MDRCDGAISRNDCTLRRDPFVFTYFTANPNDEGNLWRARNRQK
jgi:hypothetical protein